MSLSLSKNNNPILIVCIIICQISNQFFFLHVHLKRNYSIHKFIGYISIEPVNNLRVGLHTNQRSHGPQIFKCSLAKIKEINPKSWLYIETKEVKECKVARMRWYAL